eukprot:g22933.t1
MSLELQWNLEGAAFLLTSATAPLQRRSRPRWQRRSSPCIVAAHNLRQYSLDRKRISLEHTSSAPDFSHLDRIDLIGGNGRRPARRTLCRPSAP